MPRRIDLHLTVCSAHHWALHRGQLRVQRGADGTVIAVRADGRCSQRALSRSSPAQAVQAKVRSGLCGMGFRRTEVDRVLRDLAAQEELREAAADQWLRRALLRLTRPVAQPPAAG